MNNTQEIWKSIVGYEETYMVSNMGNVKSIEKVVAAKNGASRIRPSKVLKKCLVTGGYYAVNLWKNNKMKTQKIHKLVASAFLGHIPCKYKEVVDHINNVRTDNRLENLQLISNRENCSKEQRGKSKYTGVYYYTGRNYWYAQITLNGKSIHLGTFKNEIDAAERYKKALSIIDNVNTKEDLINNL